MPQQRRQGQGGPRRDRRQGGPGRSGTGAGARSFRGGATTQAGRPRGEGDRSRSSRPSGPRSGGSKPSGSHTWDRGKGTPAERKPAGQRTWDRNSSAPPRRKPAGKPRRPAAKPAHLDTKPVIDRQAAGDAVRLNRYLSMCGIASRRKADELIANGEVSVNGAIVTELGTLVHPGKDRVFYSGREVAAVDAPVYLVMNKPRDTITTSNDERGRTTVMDILHARKRVYPIGRLDRNTTGVLLFTNDGEFAHRLMHPKYQIPKAYLVTCSEAVTREHLEELRTGVRLDRAMTAPAEVIVIPGGKGKEIGITIHEGMNRQVRRMFETLGYDVRKLDRVAYGPITKEGLPRGASRALTPQEVRRLKSMAGIEEE